MSKGQIFNGATSEFLKLLNEMKSTKFDALSQCATIYYKNKVINNSRYRCDLNFLHHFMLNIAELELDVKQ